MPGPPITQFKPDARRLAVFRECMPRGRTSRPGAEWPHNIISGQTVVYGSGVIARRGDPVRHNVDPDELDLCRRLAREASGLLKDIGLGLGSEGNLEFRGFFIAANVDDPVSKRIDDKLIRSRFGGTIFPLATITTEPISQESQWWAGVVRAAKVLDEHQEMERDLYGDDLDDDEEESDSEQFLERWRGMLRWFQERPEFKDNAFVAIGDYDEFRNLESKKTPLPEGTETLASSFPRLFLGLTHGGSLVGLFGWVVLT